MASILIEGLRVGYIYNERTGEFKTLWQLAWSILSWPLKWLLVPLWLFVPLLRLLAVPFIFLKRQFPRLGGFLAKPFVVVWRIIKMVARWVFYPAIKWWDVARDAIKDRDWFLFVIWCVPGYLLALIYWVVLSPFVLAIPEIAWLIIQLLWEFACATAYWLRSIIN